MEAQVKEDAKDLRFGGEFQQLRGRKGAGILLGGGKVYDTPEEALEAWKANRMFLSPEVLRYAATVEMLYIWQR